MNSTKSIAIIGRLPGLSTAELESLYGPDAISPINKHALLLDLPAEKVSFSRLGGTIKLASLLTIFENKQWQDIINFLIDNIHDYITPGSKISIGISAYGFTQLGPRKVSGSALAIKKALKKSGQSARIIPNEDNELSSAQVFHNKLDVSPNIEFCIIKSGALVYLAKTENVQNITAYSARDQARPKRDARVGMLPPKLAQTIVNLASNELHKKQTILDPFCGTGVILQEAVLMGYDIYGSDIEQRMVDYTRDNLTWLEQKMRLKINSTLETADATNHNWDKHYDAVASELYLGRPLSAEPDIETLGKIIKDTDTIIKKFLSNLAGQIPSEMRLAIAVPAWRIAGKFWHLPLLDSLSQLGYNRLSFAHVDNKDLIYYREDQVVARELLVLTRK